jgi:dolichyl-phosphate-mannose--protein O-mannosyl transferase
MPMHKSIVARSRGTVTALNLDAVACVGLGAVSFLILVYRYWFPPGKIFDEIYFARAAEEYLTRQYIYENTHPPITKLLITLSTLTFGDNSYGWRFLDVVFGALAVSVLYLLIRRMTGSTLVATYGAGLFMFDGMHFVQSRIATPESFVVVFALATLYALYVCWVQAEAGPVPAPPGLLQRGAAAVVCAALAAGAAWLRFPHESLAAKLVAATVVFAGLYAVYRLRAEPAALKSMPATLLFAASFALLVASKWYGVMALGVALVIVLCTRVFRKDLFFATVVFVTGCIYFASYTPQFIGLSDTPNAPPRAYTLTDVVTMQYNAFEYHDHLRATHPYQSRWWQWPLELRPILYYAEYGGQGNTRTAAMIYTLPNPLILWVGLLTVPLVGYWGIKERNKAYCLLVLTYLAQWLPWIGSPRISFAYHFYVDIPLICACTAIVMRRVPKEIAACYFIAVAAAFVYFYPVLSGQTIPQAAWMQRMWLHSWI